MSTAYYQLLYLRDERHPLTVTIATIGLSQHFDIYRGSANLSEVSYSAEDKRRLVSHDWAEVNPFAPNLKVEVFLQALAPEAA